MIEKIKGNVIPKLIIIYILRIQLETFKKHKVKPKSRTLKLKCEILLYVSVIQTCHCINLPLCPTRVAVR